MKNRNKTMLAACGVREDPCDTVDLIRSVNGWEQTPRNARFTGLSAISTL